MNQQFNESLLNYCRKNGGVRVDIHREGNPHSFTGLNFDINGNAVLLDHKLSIITYVSNHLKYSKFPISISINGESLDKVILPNKPVLLPAEININQD